MFKPCVIIPVYNHPQKIQSVVCEIDRLGYPCYLIDDGSDSPCKELLQELANRFNKVCLERIEVNQGKGAAVCLGLRLAYQDGYSHALQVDADAQHTLSDIPKFFELAEKLPKNVITGMRACDDSPKIRVYGRMLMNALVWLHMLSSHVKDSMCGFRVYPLKQVKVLLDSVTIGKRMSFDTDILVRLYWSGVDVSQISTKVIYRDDVPSHYKYVRDNLRITVMHLKLLFGMIIRARDLLSRHSKSE